MNILSCGGSLYHSLLHVWFNTHVFMHLCCFVNLSAVPDDPRLCKPACSAGAEGWLHDCVAGHTCTGHSHRVLPSQPGLRAGPGSLDIHGSMCTWTYMPGALSQSNGVVCSAGAEDRLHTGSD